MSLKPTRSRQAQQTFGHFMGRADSSGSTELARTQRATLLALCLCAYMAPRPVLAESFIAKGGEPRASIVIADKAARSVKLAAKELQHFIEKITGAKLPITAATTHRYPVKIFVGKSVHTDQLGINGEALKYGAFRIVSGESWLALLGDDADFKPIEPYAHDHTDGPRVMKEWDALTKEKWGNPMMSLHRSYAPALGIWEHDGRGSLNAVYGFLRDLGCRWYFPGEIGEILPKMKSIALPKVDRTVRPDFPVRNMLFYFNEFWMARKGIPHGIEDVKWQLRLGLSPYESVLGPGLGHGTMAVHSREEVKRAHPEYYALWGGKRATVHLGNYGAGCLSSPGLFEQNVKYVRFLFDHYQVPMVSVAPADGYGSLCQCDGCRGKDTPERGWTGSLSDYVWEYTNRVAREVYKTHPDKHITCIAYSTYLLPPDKIEQMSPNVVVGFCYWRSQLAHPEERQRYRDLIEAWLKKLPSKKVFIWDYHRYNMPGKGFESVPVIFPHAIAEDLTALKGVSLGDYIEVYRNHRTHDLSGNVLASDHVNCYVNARMLWDASLDVDALLDEYCRNYYGPAAREMMAFVQYSEANWMRATKDPKVIDRFFELIPDAQKAAGRDNVYARRVAMMVEFMERMKQLRERLLKGRDDTPKVRLLVRDQARVALDGRLDEELWQGRPVYRLVNLETGAEPYCKTWFRVAWIRDSLYFGIRCDEPRPESLNIAARKDGDMGIWNGDNVEILLETQTHSYYQIAISPNGKVVDLDRKDRLDTRWSSGAQVASHIGEDHWSLEVRIPAAGDMAASVDPLNGVAGRKPSNTYPWYFNIGRQRVRENGKELTAFSPTGKPDFHVVLKFARFVVP